MQSDRPRGHLTARLAGRAGLGAGDVMFAALLGVLAAVSASGIEGSNAHSPNAGWEAAIAVLTMTAPVAMARRYPVPVTVALAAGAALNWVWIGQLTRCGAALPAIFYAAYVLGWRCTARRGLLLGALAVSGNVVCQACADPQLGASVLVYMIPIALAFTVAGLILAGRSRVVAQLREHTTQLRAQRERTAALAVATDKARIAADLDGFLQARVERIATAASSGREALAADPTHARQAFITIQAEGRATLSRMRDVVAGLHDPAAIGGAPADPAPVLAQLDHLLAEATEGHAKLRVVGDPQLLPPGLDLSGYRIVEQLLHSLDAEPDAGVDVTVAFEPGALLLTVAGPSRRPSGAQVALSAARERVEVHGGTLRTTAADGRRTTSVWLPVVAGHG